jgi:hypothetical protein
MWIPQRGEMVESELDPHGGLKNAPHVESGMWKFHTGLVTYKKPVTRGEE